MNKSIVMGRLTAQPELRQTQNGTASCRFTVAVNRRFKNANGEYDADFIPCVAWRQTAEFVSRYFSKGSMICVEGSLRTGSYQDRNHSDVTHYTTDLYVDNVEFCGSKQNNGEQQTQQTAPAQATQTQPQNTQYAEFEALLDEEPPF